MPLFYKKIFNRIKRYLFQHINFYFLTKKHAKIIIDYALKNILMPLFYKKIFNRMKKWVTGTQNVLQALNVWKNLKKNTLTFSHRRRQRLVLGQ